VVAKQVADLITFTRGLLIFVFPWLGLTQGAESLPWAAALLAADWTGDSVDGTIARRSRVKYQTWIGDHDLEIDMAVSIGLLIYMLLTGSVQPVVGILYFLLWTIYFWRSGNPRAAGMLFQAPIYGWFIYTAIQKTDIAGWLLVAWIVVALVVTWPKFPNEVVPDFLHGFRGLFREDLDPSGH
jgi:phosphatidylglycerophosphate synthase